MAGEKFLFSLERCREVAVSSVHSTARDKTQVANPIARAQRLAAGETQASTAVPPTIKPIPVTNVRATSTDSRS